MITKKDSLLLIPLLVTVLVTGCSGTKHTNIGFTSEQCNATCGFRIHNLQEARQQFAAIDMTKVWLVYLEFSPGNASNFEEVIKIPALADFKNVVWANKHSTPFLFFDDDFETFSFFMLTDSVALIKMSMDWEPSGCFLKLTKQCLRLSIAENLLRNITEKRGDVCFKHQDGTTPSCCEWPQDEGINCDIISTPGWRLVDIRSFGFSFFVIYHLLPFLILCLPSLPDPRDQVELTSLQDPSPLSLCNVFVTCFSNHPESSTRDCFVRFSSRIFVLLVVIPFMPYMYCLIEASNSYKTILTPEPPFEQVFILILIMIHYGIFASISVIIAIAPPIGFADKYYHSFPFIGRKTVHPNLVVHSKNVWEHMCSGISTFSSRYLPLCCRGKPWKKCSLAMFIIMSPLCILVYFLLYAVALSVFPAFTAHSYAARISCHIASCFFNNSLASKAVRLLSFLVLVFYAFCILLFCGISLILLLMFLQYTIIGFVLNYQSYLALASSVAIAFTYIYRFYHLTNESYSDLRKCLFEVCIKLQQQLDSQQEAHDIVNAEQDGQKRYEHQQQQNMSQQEQIPLQQPLLQQQLDSQQEAHNIVNEEQERNEHEEMQHGQLLIYEDKDTGSKRMKKQLFNDACKVFKPLVETFYKMVFKMIVFSMLVIMILNAVLTLTQQTAMGVVMQTLIVLFTAALPQLFFIPTISKANKSLEKLEMKYQLEKFVLHYLEN